MSKKSAQDSTPVDNGAQPVLSGTISTNVENLSKDILRDEIKLQRFNLAFRQNAAKQGRWKGWRYFMSQEGNVVSTEAGLIVGATERGYQLHTKASTHTSKNILANGGVLPGAIGSFLQMHAILTGVRTYNLSGGIFGTVSGGLIILDPILSRLYAMQVEKMDKQNMIAHGLPQVWENGEKLDRDYEHLTSFCKNHQVKDRPEMSTILARLDAYDANHTYCVDEIQRNDRALRRGNRTAIQNMSTGFLVGSTKIANATLADINGAKYIHDGTRTNSLFFAANVAYLPGVTWGIPDNVRIQVGREKDRSRQKASHTLPNQITQGRLDQLNSIEKRI